MIRIRPDEINENVFRLIDKEWMLITAGQKEHYNTMTASWGGFGILWHDPVAFIFVRPQRYTYEFLEQYDEYTLCFFDEGYRKALNYCGSHSGREGDKALATGLTPLATPNGNIYFKQGRMVIECRKIYFNDIEPLNFRDDHIEKNYPKKDYHRMYIGRIINCWRD